MSGSKRSHLGLNRKRPFVFNPDNRVPNHDDLYRIGATQQAGENIAKAKQLITIDPAEAFRSFRGRDPKVEALMKKRGFGG